MNWSPLDPRAWNFPVGAAAVMAASSACGPFVIPGETDSETDPSATDPTTPGGCNDASGCQPGYECIDNVCTPYGDEYYCNDGSGGCCYGDGCGYAECYTNEDCGPVGLCNYNYCALVTTVPECEGPIAILPLELPAGTGGEFLSLAFVDANGDAAQDLFVGRDGSAELHLGPGGAPPLVLPVPLAVAPIDAVSGDFDGDGDMDLVVSSTASGLVVLLGDGAGGFAMAMEGSVGDDVHDLAALEWDGDGALDVAGVDSEGNTTVFPGSGTGSFVEFLWLGTPDAAYAMAATDFGNDALGDLVVQDASVASVFFGAPADDLSPDTTLPGGVYGQRRLASGSIDGTPPPYEVVGHTEMTGWRLLELWPEGFFGPQLYGLDGPGTLADIGDFDGDGLEDVVAAGDMAIQYVRGATEAQSAILSCQSTYLLGAPIGAMAVGDFDGDARADVAVESSGTLTVLLTQ